MYVVCMYLICCTITYIHTYIHTKVDEEWRKAIVEAAAAPLQYILLCTFFVYFMYPTCVCMYPQGVQRAAVEYTYMYNILKTIAWWVECKYKYMVSYIRGFPFSANESCTYVNGTKVQRVKLQTTILNLPADNALKSASNVTVTWLITHAF